ncbi:MAG: hypothetical protein HPY59_16825 [Anaerolineae bacterium]|nr:hypothetical protein [Anaerolineae bacterium]
MDHVKKIFLAILACFILIGLTACSPAAAGPRLIAAAQATPIAVYPTQAVPLLHTVTVYNLTLELEVNDVQAAAAEAIRLNTSYGGALVTSQSWFEGKRSVVFLEFAVPDGQSARLHTALLQLGRTTGENYATYAHDCLTCQPFSHISLYLRSANRLLPALPASGWNPERTLQASWRVFTAIFGFLVDVIIWVAVVVGPFALAGWGIAALVRRLRGRAGAARKPDEEKPA